MNTALLLSGGIGSRISADIPKQYLCIGGRMLITYALETLIQSPFVDGVEIVAEQKWRDAIRADAEKEGLDAGKIVGFSEPGHTRQESILNGLKALLRVEEEAIGLESIDERDTVLIHDAARPFLSGRLIEECHAAFAGHDGVMPVLPMKDTVYLSKNGRRVEGLLERSTVYAGQSPELFLLKKYYLANMELFPDRIMNINGSTEAAVMAGMDVVIIPGEEKNFKVTTDMDLEKFREQMK